MSDQKTAVDVLREARALVEKGWTQGTYARTATGEEVEPLDPMACVFCVNGAMQRAVGTGPGSCAAYIESKNTLRQSIGKHYTMTWNDTPGRTQAEVLAAFDKAIELAQAEQTA